MSNFRFCVERGKGGERRGKKGKGRGGISSPLAPLIYIRIDLDNYWKKKKEKRGGGKEGEPMSKTFSPTKAWLKSKRDKRGGKIEGKGKDLIPFLLS